MNWKTIVLFAVGAALVVFLFRRFVGSTSTVTSGPVMAGQSTTTIIPTTLNPGGGWNPGSAIYSSGYPIAYA